MQPCSFKKAGHSAGFRTMLQFVNQEAPKFDGFPQCRGGTPVSILWCHYAPIPMMMVAWAARASPTTIARRLVRIRGQHAAKANHPFSKFCRRSSMPPSARRVAPGALHPAACGHVQLAHDTSRRRRRRRGCCGATFEDDLYFPARLPHSVVVRGPGPGRAGRVTPVLCIVRV